MNLKSTILTAALLIASAVASASTPITLTPSATTANAYSAAFSGAAASNTFDLDLSGFSGVSNFVGQVSANFTGGSGYDVTGVTLDGASFLPLLNSTFGNTGADYWLLLLPTLSATVHQIVVSGTPMANTQGFVGSLSLSVIAVPEPETYAMLIAGLGLVGFMARRRKA